MDDDAILRPIAFGKQTAERVAFLVGKVLLTEQRVAERQAGGNAVFPREGKRLLRGAVAGADASAAPDAVRRRAVDRADPAPVVKVLPVRAIERQKYPVQLVKLK